MAAGKRKRAAGFSERDKFEHKSATLLQREAKKVRAFLARKAVQQLKQAAASGTATAKQQTQQATRERELAALKALDLKAVVARAFETTGLHKQQQQEAEDGDHDEGSDDEIEFAGVEGEEEEEDSGFDSEEYENAAGIGRGAAKASSDDEDDDDEEESVAELKQKPKQKPVESSKPAGTSAEQLNALLVDRVLAHKQMKPLLDAIHQWVEKEAREEEKRERRQEKRALKRGRKEELIGGRSAAMPTSLFLGSLSGRGDVGDDAMDGTRTGQLAGADDDIAEFLGEKKKKNRPGQMARRQKAMRQEEARKRQEDRENGIFRPHHRSTGGNDEVMGKYGPSARPKKSKKEQQKQRKQNHHGSDGFRHSTKDSDKANAKPDRSARSRGGDFAAAAQTTVAPKVEVSHPSWLAKQAQKEKERVDIHSFTGKKITFGDD